MKKKNREALRLALSDYQLAYQLAYRIFISDTQKREEYEEHGLKGEVSPTSKYSHENWMLAMDNLEETVERILEDER